MKFPINVTGKKPQNKHSVNDENDRNKANVIGLLDEKLDTPLKTTSVLLQRPKSQWSTAVPDMVHARTASESVCTSTASDMACVKTDTKIVCEQRQKDLLVPSENSGEDISCKRRGSLEDEGFGSFENYEEDDEDVRPCSRASSLYDDSGFNSSASDDREDEYSLANVNYDCDYEDNESEEQELPFEDCQNTQTDSISVLDSVTKESVQRTESVSSRTSSDIKSVSELENDKESESSESSKQSDRIVLNLDTSKSIVVRDLKRHSRTQRTDATGDAPNVNSIPRPRTTQRRRARDCNNNVNPKDFRSHLLTPPFRLGDCFRGQGLLSLGVCIAYTLFLVFVFGALGLLADTLKAVFGKKELNEMRRNLRQSSRRRSPVNCG